MNWQDKILTRLKLSGNRRKIVRNLFWSVMGKIITLAGNLLAGIIIARFLGAEKYGIMNYVISFVTLFQVIALFGLDNIEVREEAKKDKDPNVIIGTAFAIKMILAIITFFITVAVSFFIEDDINTTIYVAVYALSVIANTLTVIRNRFTSLVQNEFVVKAEIIRTLIGIIIKIVLWQLNVHLIWFIAAMAFDFVLLGAGYIVAYKIKLGKIKEWKFDRQYAKFLIKEAFPLLLTSAAVFIYQRIDQVMIGNLVDKEAVGFFATATRFVEILMFIPAMLTHTITPILVETRKKNKKIYNQKAQTFMNITFWTSLGLATVLSLLAFWIVRYTYGENYLQAVPIMKVLAFKVPAFALSTTAGAMLVIEGLQKWAIIRDLFGCVVCIALNWMLLEQFGAIAAAAIAIVSYVCAGYLADSFIPQYRHLFKIQTNAIINGWKDFLNIRKIIRPNK